MAKTVRQPNLSELTNLSVYITFYFSGRSWHWVGDDAQFNITSLVDQILGRTSWQVLVSTDDDPDTIHTLNITFGPFGYKTLDEI